MEQRRAFKRATVVVIAVLMIPYPGVFAQPLEVGDVETTRAAVETQVERLVTELVARDPELAQEIERQSEACLRDMSDGRLEAPEFTKEIETYRDVQRDLAEHVMQGEMEARIAEATASGNRELAESMRNAFEAFQAVGESESANRGDARQMFEQAYSEALSHDPEGAQHMKEMFEAAERGEMARPTPEMMERMREEMGEYLKENPEMREYAAVEWDRMTEHGRDRGGFGPEGHGPERMDGRDMPEGPWRDMPEGPWRDMPEGPWRDMPEGMTKDDMRDPADVDRFREMMDRDRDTSIILDGNIERFGPPPDGGGGTPPPEDKPHTLVQDNPPGMHDGWDGGDPDSSADHPHPDGTAPHNGI